MFFEYVIKTKINNYLIQNVYLKNLKFLIILNVISIFVFEWMV